AAIVILKQMLSETDLTDKARKQVTNELVLSLIGLARFPEAMHTISPKRFSPGEMDIHSTFNYAMAEWAETGKPPTDLFGHVVELDKHDGKDSQDANYFQCLALAHWAVGNADQARTRIQQAIDLMKQRRWPNFSCWRYGRTSGKVFVEDCRAISRLIAGE